MTRLSTYFLLLGLLLSACNPASDMLLPRAKENQGIDIMDVSFSPDHDTIYVAIDVLSDLHGYSLSDTSQVKVRISETIDGIPMAKHLLPRIYDIENTMSEGASKALLSFDIIADLTLPQNLVDQQRMAVSVIRNTFNPEGIYISFMANDSLSTPVPATPYAIDNFFKSKEGSSKRLYRSIVEARDALRDRHRSDNLALIVMSDGCTYRDDMPMDPQQFKYQQELTLLYPELVADSLSIYYINFDNTASGAENDAYPLLLNMAEIYRGEYLDSFDINRLESLIKEEYELSYHDYMLMLVNPDNKVYDGASDNLKIELLDKQGNILAQDSFEFSLGTPYRPIVVGDKPLGIVIVQGIFLGLVILLLTYIALQLIVPWARYRTFQKKYVLRYTGDNMTNAGHMVGDTCYLCKDKFQIGDEIVAKCEHTMHHNCWDEIGYHCPEYGRHCPQGSHYYNRANIFDMKNAPGYSLWVYVAIIAAIITWTFFTLEVNIGTAGEAFQNFERGELGGFGDCSLDVPFFGLCIGGGFTLAFSLLIIRKPLWWQTALSIALRTVVAAVSCYLLFFLEVLVVGSFNATAYSYLFDWIPWSVSGIAIVDLSTIHTRIKPKRIQVIASMLAGLLSMYVWQIFATGQVLDYRVLILLSFLIFSVALSLCISNNKPLSERYYLAMKGDVKPIDIALYKWFVQDPDAVVTMGKAIDCSICLSWDILGQVMPEEAQIINLGGKIYLCTLEEGVEYRGKILESGRRVRLRHGTRFMIGNTEFTYLEKDL